MDKVIKSVDKSMAKASKQNEFLAAGKVGPIHEDYPWSNCGLHIYIGRPGSGKSWSTLKHLLICQSLPTGPYYSKIVYAGRQADNDETYKTHKKKLLPWLIEVKPDKLLDFLKAHIKKKDEYYAMYKFVMSDMKDPNSTMVRILNENANLFYKRRSRRGPLIFDPQAFYEYAMEFFTSANTGRYPLPLYIMLDDGSSSDLIAKKDSEIVQLLKHSVRHMHITVGIMTHTITDSIKELRRLISDVVFYKKVHYDDLELALKTIPTGFNEKEIWPIYSRMKGKHSHLIFHTFDGTYEVVEV